MDIINAMKEGKSHGINKISSELLKNGGNFVVTIFTILCQKSWNNKICPAQWNQSLVIPIPKKGDLKKCKNYRKLSVICHSINILINIIFKRLNPQVEQILYYEQVRVRKGRNTFEQVFNCRNLIDKHLNKKSSSITS